MHVGINVRLCALALSEIVMEITQKALELLRLLLSLFLYSLNCRNRLMQWHTEDTQPQL